LPPGYDGRTPAPAIIRVPGLDDSGAALEQMLRLPGKARAHGAIYVLVEGTVAPTDTAPTICRPRLKWWRRRESNSRVLLSPLKLLENKKRQKRYTI
jgi:hypothetical protein